MKRKQILFSVLLLFSVVATQAARVDTIMVKSPSMNKEVQVVYVLPDKALGEEAEACPCGDFTLVREAQNKGLIATLRMSGDGLNAFYQLMVLTIGINMKDRDGF